MKSWDKTGYFRLDDVAAYFFAFALVGVGIAIAIYGFYGQDIDVRGEEARIMNYKIYNVVRERDNLNSDLYVDGFDILGAAGIDKKVFNNGDYYYRIQIFISGQINRTVFLGNPDYGVECDLELENPKEKASANFPICHLTLEKLNNGRELRILTASNQRGERI